MTTKQAKAVLHSPYKPLVIAALSYVNLTDREIETLFFRHIRGHTQEETAEKLSLSPNGVQNIEKAALQKCAYVWDKLAFVKEVLDK